MYAFLRTPRWIGASLVVAIIAVLFVNLGLWQLRRLDDRRLRNDVLASRLAEPPIALLDALDAIGSAVDSLEYRPVTVTGEFDTAAEILVRSQVHEGSAGFHVITPLIVEGGGSLLVNRGWVPLALEAAVDQVPPPPGRVEETGLVRLSQPRPAIGPVEPAGSLEQVARLDLDRLAEQFDGLLPVWLQETGGSEDALPIPLTLPDTEDEGPHLAYAIQWFLFALIGLIGFGFLIRRSARIGGR